MARVCQKLLTVARPMFEHAERIISRILLHLHAKAALLWQAAFDLHALRTIVFAHAFAKWIANADT
jgi:hypothetical protein